MPGQYKRPSLRPSSVPSSVAIERSCLRFRLLLLLLRSSPTAPSVALDPDSAGQHASVTSRHLLGTGGLLFAVVALVSVAGYFYHGRGTASSSQTSSTWASLSNFWLSMRHRGSATTSTAVATDWPVDLEVGFEVGWRHVPAFSFS